MVDLTDDVDKLHETINVLTTALHESSEAMSIYGLLTQAIDRYLVQAPPEQCDVLLKIVKDSGYNERFSALALRLNARPPNAMIH